VSLVRKSKKAQEKIVLALMAEKTRMLTQAQALEDLGMHDAARSLWTEIAGREERLAPLMEALGREREAALHRVSAASCYERVDDYSRAVNLYRAALAGPLLESTRQEVTEMVQRCLVSLVPHMTKTKPGTSSRDRKDAMVT
jgi:hypothetical protein